MAEVKEGSYTEGAEGEAQRAQSLGIRFLKVKKM